MIACALNRTGHHFRLRSHGLIKKIGHRYKYYLTHLGRRIIATVLAIREFVVQPCGIPTN